MSDFRANDNDVSPNESRRFKLITENPSLGSAVIVSKIDVINMNYKYKTKKKCTVLNNNSL